MPGFLLRRLDDIVPTFFGITLLVFFLIRLIPGNPILIMAGARGIDAAARYAELQAQYGFDQPQTRAFCLRTYFHQAVPGAWH